MTKATDNQWDKYSKVDFDKALKCSHCGGDRLHHSDVSVFIREEDAAVGLMVYASPNMTHVAYKESQAANPSARRDGVTISMWCEFCTGWSYYHIVQHKGFTVPFMTGSAVGESE